MKGLMMKSYSKAVAVEQDVFGAPDFVELTIKGLVEISPGKFRLEGVRAEPLDSAAVAEAIRSDDERLIDEVCELVFRRKLTALLAERVVL